MKKVILTIVGLLVIGSAIMLFANANTPKRQVKIGVIDTSLSLANEVKVKKTLRDERTELKSFSHADMIVDIIKRESKDSEIYLANVLDENNTSSTENIVPALDWLKSKKVDIICMSFATTKEDNELKRKIFELQNEGIILVAACINYSDVICYPANYEGVISVANCKNEDAILEITDKSTKDYLKSLKWKECGTSALNAYITGKIASEMRYNNFKLEQVIKDMKKLKK